VADIKTHVNTVTHFVAEILMSELFCIAHQIELPFVEKLLPYDRFTSIFFSKPCCGKLRYVNTVTVNTVTGIS